MRLSENPNTYSVEVSASAWKQLAHLPLETYQRLRHELDAIASRLKTPTPLPLPQKDAEPLLTRSLSLEGYVAIYEVDAARRRLMLREVARGHRGP